MIKEEYFLHHSLDISNNGKSIVIDGNKLGHINNKGEIVVPLTVENKLKYDEYLNKYTNI